MREAIRVSRTGCVRRARDEFCSRADAMASATLRAASRRQTAVSPDCKARLAIHRAPYQVNGQVVGTLGVIGPTRTAYDRMIQIVDITSRLVSNALSQK